MTVLFTGSGSVIDRTLFTRKGPIVKVPLPLLVGADLKVLGPLTVSIPSGSFTESNVGHSVRVSGTPSGRNDGTFPIAMVLSPTKLQLSGSSFDVTDTAMTVSAVVSLVNALKTAYNLHRTQSGVHGVNDTFNPSVSQVAVDLSSAIILANEIRAKFALHVGLSGPTPNVHKAVNADALTGLPVASDMASVILLVNALKDGYESHRRSLEWHAGADMVNVVNVGLVRPVLGSGPMVGPFPWTLFDPRVGQLADDTSDVTVKVNGVPASVDAVFGLLGAVVLTTKPGPADTVTIDYSYMPNIPVQMGRLNSSEFGLNQYGNRGICGLPGHQYRARSYLVDPLRYRAVMSSPSQPLRTRWKYKALERSGTAALNDPNTLLLNVPSNMVAYPVLSKGLEEVTVRYDPVTLPSLATDPWALEGEGLLSLAPGGGELTVVDTRTASGPSSRPPFFTHSINLQFDCVTSAAFRMRAEPEIVFDGAYSGVGFGLSDGSKTILVGLLKTRATNLSSAIVIANSAKAKFGSHLVTTGVHRPDDPVDTVDVVDAKDLPSLLALVNRLKKLYNDHVAKGPLSVHVMADALNHVSALDAVSEAQAVGLVNAIVDALNLHLVQSGIHYVDDTVNAVPMAKQVGILTNRGFPEFDASWDTFAVDWSEYTTYRVSRPSDGSGALFLSGQSSPIVKVLHSDLPATSELDMRVDPMQQVFFGSVGAQTASTSRWAFVRVNVSPVDFTQIGVNKSVSYTPAVVPELDPIAPWITVGQSGFERAQSGSLLSDSSGGVAPSDVEDLGATTGSFKGYLRLEPVLSSATSCVLEFTVRVGYWTHGLDNRAIGVFLDDELLSTHLVFLQATPTPATAVGTSVEPFGIAANDTLTLSFGDGAAKTVLFPAPITSVADVVSVINLSLGFPFASASGLAVKLTDSVTGSASQFRLTGGVALSKLGLSPGTYFGRDSNPEPKAVWLGLDFPDLGTPSWTRSGNQVSELLNRTLRITDVSIADFRAYGLSDTLYTAPVLSPSEDWKFDARLKVLSFVAGSSVMAGSNLLFCGVLMSLDEGPSGKNVELQTAKNASGSPFVNVLSYDAVSDSLMSMAELLFPWDDGRHHSYSVYTSKAANLVLILGDNVLLGTVPYSSLRPGYTVPSVNFGSGANPVGNADLQSSRSVVDWDSVAVFRDRKVSDPSSASRRYVGIYGGGNPELLSSYHVSQVDWTGLHTYKIVRDPVQGVTVFIDGGSIPAISVSYDPLKLPPSDLSFLKTITDSRSCVAFGGFSPFDMTRSVWSSLKYSMGKITMTDRRIPPHQVLNQVSLMASPDHLRTVKPHAHAGFQSYSGGTPLDDSMVDASIVALADLGEGMVPVPLSRDLETAGGLKKVVTPLTSIPTVGFVDARGFMSDYEDDKGNVINRAPAILESEAVSLLILRVNSLRSAFNLHIVRPGVHVVDDVFNQVLSPPASGLSSSIALLNDIRSSYAAHRVLPGAHVHDDNVNVVSLPPATDLESAVLLMEALAFAFDGGPTAVNHIGSSGYHAAPDTVNTMSIPDVSPLTMCVSVLNELKADYNLHIADPAYHVPDALHVITAADAVDLTTSMALANSAKAKLNAHFQSYPTHLLPDASSVISVLDATDVNSLILLVQSLKSGYEAHRIRQGAHGHDDDPTGITAPVATEITSVCILLNNIKSVYEAHRVNTDVHMGADTLHPIVSAAAVDQPTATLLAADLRGNLNAHFAGASHVTPDSFNAILGTTADLTSLIAMANEIRSKVASHFVQVRLGMVDLHVHGNVDTVHTVAAPTPVAGLVAMLDSFQSKYGAHRVSAFHTMKDSWNLVTAKATYDVGPPEAYEVKSIVTWAVDCASKFNSHVIKAGVHSPVDALDQVSVPAHADDDINFAIVLANSLKAAFNAHIQGVSYHVVKDAADALSSSPARSPLSESLTLLSDLVAKNGLHVVRERSHVVVDPGSAVIGSPSSLATAIIVANSLKSAFNAHLIKPDVHVRNDTFNAVTSPDATDKESLGVLVNSLRHFHNAHMVQVGVHGSSVLVRLDPPSGVLYDSMKTFVESTGVGGLVSPVSDDETWTVGAIRQDRPHALNYGGGLPPEMVTFVSWHVSPFRLLDGDTMSVQVDSGPADNVVFSASDSSVPSIVDRVNTAMCRFALNEVLVRFNAHLVQQGVHVVNDTWNAVPLSPALDLATSISLANQIKYRVQLHEAQAGVHVVNDTWNPVGSGYASDLPSLISLTNALIRAYAGHRTQAGVHVSGDKVNIVLRTGADVARDNGDGRVRLVSPTVGPSSSISVGGLASVKLGLDVSQFTPWVVRSTNPSSVEILPVQGFDDFLSYKVVGAGTDTLYRSNTGLPDAVSFDFEMVARVRVNNAYISGNGDSGVFVGMNGVPGPGFSVAVGFEVDTVTGGLYVKLQDLKAGKPVLKRLFNWNDGQFHTYKIVRRASDGTMDLIVVE